MAKKCTDIWFEYDDGTVEEASGEAAERIKAWMDHCEAMALAHGSNYSGPTLTTLAPPEQFPVKPTSPKNCE